MDPYKTLGIPKNATQDEVKNAYRNLAKKFHPDLNPGNKESETKFKSITSAYNLIGNPDDRGKFDRGETPEQMEEAARAYANHSKARPGGFGFESGGPDFSANYGGAYSEDFFESLFGKTKSARGRRSSTDFPGEDLVFTIEVDLKDAIRGAQKEISLPNGKKLQIKIPAGTEPGARLRFRGQGSPGHGKGAPGDLYLELQLRPLKGFVREGNDLISELPLSFLEAIQGAEVPVNTLDGIVSLKVPPGVSTGSRLRIRGKGVNKGPKVGDQIVVLKIVMPKKIDPELGAAVKAWGDRFSYNPRTETQT